AILGKLQSNQTSCSNLTDDDFDKLGDYYMGQMMGTSHSTMDALMAQRIGEDNDRLMHIALGKRLSGCDVSAAFPVQGAGFLPMMGMMGGLATSYGGYQPNYSMMGNFGYPNGYSMMGYGGFPSGWAGILWMVLIIVGAVLFIRWAIGQSRTRSGNKGKTALSILENRYAKGEIDRKEFEEKKKDLND
ncbi:MAG TPA: SHOCT domain-containing protein, partial [Opitutales bacterium]|nr:SHOCT domain-containing protein [Opitutales bacterium]